MEKTYRQGFIDTLARVLRQINGYGGCHAQLRFAQINQAIAGARRLGVIPQAVPVFSREEISKLGKEFLALKRLRMYDELQARFLEVLRERGVVEKILEEVCEGAKVSAVLW